MLTFGPLGITTPLALLALAALPLIWLVIRALPPAPREQVFPPTALLANLPNTEETPKKTPPWLAWFRMLALGLFVLGFSGPVLNPVTKPDTRPLLIVIDDGWTSAPSWRAVTDEAAQVARASSGPVRLLWTTHGGNGARPLEVLSPSQAAARILAAQPKPVLPDPSGALGALKDLPTGQRILWFSDGVAHAKSQAFAERLTQIGSVRLRGVPEGAVAITRAAATSEGYSLGVVTGPATSRTQRLEAVNSRGQSLRETSVALVPTGVSFALESVVMRDVAALRTADARSAGGVFLLDAFDRRVRTGLIAERQDDQPLLSDAHYLEGALKPYTDLTRANLTRLIDAGLDALILPDAGELGAQDSQALERFVRNGGLLIRTAGPKLLAAGPSPLIPAALAPEPRTVRGSMTWDNAGKIGVFDPTSPFAGLTVPDDARVTQIAVLAPEASAGGTTSTRDQQALQIWARLADGTPLVTARELGKGKVVLFHTTAGPAWSDVAFSGVQVAMLRRVLAQAASSAIPANFVVGTAPLKPVLVLDGFGTFRAPDPQIRPIRPEEVQTAQPSLDRPPGIYEGGGVRWILQAAAPNLRLDPLPDLAKVERVAEAERQPQSLAGPFLGLGMALLLIDMIVSLWLAGKLAGLKRLARWRGQAKTGAAMAGLLLFGLMFFGGAPEASAQTTKAKPRQGDLSLAYIKTGDGALDAQTQRGLEGLSRALRDRTSVEPGPVIGLDPSRDDLALYPILFWTLGEAATETRPEVASALDRYMKNGGVLFVDSRGGGRTPAMARQITRAALRGIEAPPLAPVPDGHVLTKAFYILQRFPGRYPDAKLWVETEASAAASANDGVSPLILGDGDWASVWARAPNSPSTSMMQGFDGVGPTTNELAIRVGINIVLYALTGNYKADQVHAPALLERLGRRQVPPR
ncbi:DUF4159 domain-containing protein [Aquidulcibacter sp.]|uniref:DUF4159 domain-containing protein n=1 Tax=Aquidulcibacter sp. TaxID=2052990 RepID=UPI0025BB67A7|nr:DUF4159 domain-containing protein [Aquidulcibacter sp.]MCA3692113.1 DUF4159 domain-containing protein [Aquidulcibacter sp.]